MTEAKRGPKVPATPVALVHRLEGGAIAALAGTLFVLSGFAWWWLLAVFLLFDVSAIGYAVNIKAGAVGYNAVHNYVAPALVAAIYGILLVAGVTIWPLAFVAGCWFFHVGVDRALGYGPRPDDGCLTSSRRDQLTTSVFGGALHP